MQYQNIPEGKDPQMWRLAEKRASFKIHLLTYIVINLFLWMLWYFTKGYYNFQWKGSRVPWPIFPMLGWGVGIVFHFLSAYVLPQENSVEKEYHKLVQSQDKHQHVI
ncbi:MAG: 2TM domain-containing protein [Candidatus Dadabacteria bacterium]